MKYKVKKGSKLFTVMVNESKLHRGELICEITEGYVKKSVFYGGTDPATGNSILMVNDDILYLQKGVEVNPGSCREAYAEHYKEDMYMIEASGGRVFYEACRDMSEKRALYEELDAKITCIYKYTREKRAKNGS